MKKKLSTQKGFTLIELLIVIAIIGILASVLMVNFIGVRQRARDTQRKSDLRQIQTALELYRSDFDAYPLGITCGSPIAETTTVYMQKVPCDPLGSSTTYNNGAYYFESTGTYSYTLVACLENASDQQKSTDTPPPGASGTCPSNSYYILYNP